MKLLLLWNEKKMHFTFLQATYILCSISADDTVTRFKTLVDSPANLSINDGSPTPQSSTYKVSWYSSDFILIIIIHMNCCTFNMYL